MTATILNDSRSFTPDEDLRYAASSRIPADGAPLTLDRNYRFAHLPLVNPDHPDVIPEEPERGYRMGLHANVRSLVLPIDHVALFNSPGFAEILAWMRTGPLAQVIGWDSFEARKTRLHATIAGSLSRQDEAQAKTIAAQINAEVGLFQVALRGLFSGNINTGRLYLKLYPELREGQNVLDVIQQGLGREPSRLYVVGLFNLTDHLSPVQAAHLAEALRRWGKTPVLTTTVSELLLLDSRDDLVLDAEIVERITLSAKV